MIGFQPCIWWKISEFLFFCFVGSWLAIGVRPERAAYLPTFLQAGSSLFRWSAHRCSSIRSGTSSRSPTSTIRIRSGERWSDGKFGRMIRIVPPSVVRAQTINLVLFFARFLALSSMLCIPGYAIYIYFITPGSFHERCQLIFRPDVTAIIEEQRIRSMRERGLSTMTPV